ncbi:Auxin-responsive protein IAA13, putative isoform 1 [Hibiscus syriacus]|uniref:Auxin-responsive protein IAA13, putative isoform 1 n=1 Tax=Hibiscus syriacus TaxID=106335 RepID=A0A6A2Z9M9_HIBSY|nr:uncharacterized protein LOC120148793 [Hibiscus syriacus]KAE8688407.1 Auxin-responsive protein IAA13, putative isoform 1 [Hibiscus syriacus]
MSISAPFQLLEINMISAQDLEPVCRRKMKTYAVAWVHSRRKLSTRIDTQGHTDPTWNDKFVFRVDDEFLHRDTSYVTIEMYAVHWFRDVHVGTIRVIVGNLIPTISQRRHHREEVELGMRFVALQVWRPSGRPQGILNIGVALLDSTMSSMPLYMQTGSSAVGYRHLMGEEDPFQNSIINPVSSTCKSSNFQHLLNGLINPELRRTKSDSSSILESELKPKGSSIVNGGSMVNAWETGKANTKITTKESSMLNYTSGKIPKKGNSSSIVSGAEKSNPKIRSRGRSIVNNVFDKNTKRGKSSGKSPTGTRSPWLDNGAPKKLGRSTIWTDSELGPSPSEVAAAVARNLQHNKMEETESSMAEGWSLDESIEGLQSKLERWRTELPPLYDRGELSSYMSSRIPTTSASKSTRSGRRNRRKNRSFTCFGNIFGCGITVTCAPGASGSRKKRI